MIYRHLEILTIEAKLMRIYTILFVICNIDCSGLAMDSNGYLYAADTSKHEVRRFRIGDASGTLVAGGNQASKWAARPKEIFSWAGRASPE